MFIQRLGKVQMNDEFMDKFIAVGKKYKGSFDAIWLPSLYGYPTLETHRERAKVMKGVAKKLRDNGFIASLQISNTIGHGLSNVAADHSGLFYEGSKVEHYVDFKGTVAPNCLCPNGEIGTAYLEEMTRIYAEEIQPACVWVDDDFRVMNHAPCNHGCFCDDCIAKFNAKYGYSYEREQLVEDISYGDLKVREDWTDFIRTTMKGLAYRLAKAVHDVSPNSAMGLQHGQYGGYNGFGLGHIFEGFYEATGIAPKSRPGGGCYNDHMPHGFLGKMMGNAAQDWMLPEFVKESYPEIESTPDVEYGKSIAGTCYETSLYLAYGSNGMTYAIFPANYGRFSWYTEFLKAFSEQRAYWDKMIEANNTLKMSGASPAFSKLMWKRKFSKEDGLFKYGEEDLFTGQCELLGLGFPVCMSQTEGVKLLHAFHAKYLTDEEIQDLLTRPVLTDGETIEYLAKKGYDFGVKATYLPEIRYYTENFTDHPVNEGAQVKVWKQVFTHQDGYRLDDVSGKAEVISYYDTDNKMIAKEEGKYPCGIASAIVTTPKGAKWAVFGHKPWNNVLSVDKRNQILNSLEYISDKKLPAYLETNVRALVMARVNDEGKTANVNIVNNTIGHSGKLKLVIRNYASEKWTFMGQYVKTKTLKGKVEGDELILEIPSIPPYSTVSVFVK